MKLNFGKCSSVNPDGAAKIDRLMRQSYDAEKKASVDAMLEMLPTMLLNGSTQCPLCGQYEVHSHTPGDIIIYRNGVKYGRSAAYGGASKLSESDG